MSGFDLFGSDEHLASLEKAAKREEPFRAGKTHRFTLAFSSGDAPVLQIECLERADPERPCSILDHARQPVKDSCVVQQAWDYAGWDAVNIEGGSATLDLNMPVGYESEGHGEDFEDWIVLHLEDSE